MFKEFKEFAVKGNVMDMAVGIIIGAAFGKIVSSMVNDILMPPIGLLTKNAAFSNFFIALDGKSYPTIEAAKAAGAATLNLGMFLNTVIEFVIIAFAVFLIVRQLNRLKKEAPVAPPDTKECQYCTMTIPAKAIKCPHCTAQLKMAQGA